MYTREIPSYDIMCHGFLVVSKCLEASWQTWNKESMWACNVSHLRTFATLQESCINVRLLFLTVPCWGEGTMPDFFHWHITCHITICWMNRPASMGSTCCLIWQLHCSDTVTVIMYVYHHTSTRTLTNDIKIVARHPRSLQTHFLSICNLQSVDVLDQHWMGWTPSLIAALMRPHRARGPQHCNWTWYARKPGHTCRDIDHCLTLSAFLSSTVQLDLEYVTKLLAKQKDCTAGLNVWPRELRDLSQCSASLYFLQSLWGKLWNRTSWELRCVSLGLWNDPKPWTWAELDETRNKDLQWTWMCHMPATLPL